jgi:CubicO group peptidase (beta-lactamase class C family)
MQHPVFSPEQQSATTASHLLSAPCRFATTLRSLLFCTLFLALWAESLGADGIDPAKLKAIPERMQKFVDEHQLSGAVTIVGRKDGIVSYEAVGSANLEKNQPMRKDTLFRIASMTKPITAIGIMILADEGKLSVEDPVEKYLPEFRDQKVIKRGDGATTLATPAHPITLRHLLTHTSGMPGNMPKGMEDLYTARNHTLAEAVKLMGARPLDFEPGFRWSYCNAGIDTLGRIIEVVSGQAYESFLNERVLQRLGMADTAFYPADGQLDRAAETYDRKNGKLVPVPNTLIGSPRGARYPIPAGGLYSTGSDLAKLYQMMLNKGAFGNTRILSPESVAAMTKVQTGELPAAFTSGMGFGLGWAVVRKPEGVTAMLSPGTFGHGGAFGTQAWIDPHKDLFVILLIQRLGLPNADASEFRRELQQLAVDAVCK